MLTGSEMPIVAVRHLSEGRVSRVRLWSRADGHVRTLIQSTHVCYEAPNLTADGQVLVNAAGRLWTVSVERPERPQPIDSDGLPDVNDDHLIAPDGRTIFATGEDWRIWRTTLDGRPARRVTADDGAMHFVHTISPDGQRLGYVRLEPAAENPWASATIHTVGVDGQDDFAVTTDPGPADGCSWSPDGQWIVFNTEQFSTRPGHAQLARVRPDGTSLEQLTFDERVNWFPHWSPSGDAVLYLSFPAGTLGHPPDLEVELRLVEAGNWQNPRTVVTLVGGLGTCNSPCWSPDGTQVAFVDYPTYAEVGLRR